MTDFLSVETQSGAPIQFRDLQLVPFTRSVCLRVPGLNGGLIWNRPASVLVIDAEGREQVLPVQDPTRRIVWTLFGGTLILWLLLKGINNHNKEKTP